MSSLADEMNRSNYRIDRNTSSIAQEFVPYEKYITNKNLNKEQLYKEHVKKGKEALESFQQEYQIKKQSKEKNNENIIEEKRNKIRQKIFTKMEKFFKHRIEINNKIIEDNNKDSVNKLKNMLQIAESENPTCNKPLSEIVKSGEGYKINNINGMKEYEKFIEDMLTKKEYEKEFKCELDRDNNNTIKKNFKGILNDKLLHTLDYYDTANENIKRLKKLINTFKQKLTKKNKIKDGGDFGELYEKLRNATDEGRNYYKYKAQLDKLIEEINEPGSEYIQIIELVGTLNNVKENNNEDKFEKFFTGEKLNGEELVALDTFYEKFLKKETHILRQVPLKLGNAEVISMNKNKQKKIDEQIEKDQKNIKNLVDLYDKTKLDKKQGDEKDFFELYNYIYDNPEEVDVDFIKGKFENILHEINKGDTTVLNDFKEKNTIEKDNRYVLYCIFMFYASKKENKADKFEIGNMQGSGNYKSLSDIFIDKVLYLKNENQGGRKKKRTNKKKKTKKGNKKSKRKTRKVKK